LATALTSVFVVLDVDLFVPRDFVDADFDADFEPDFATLDRRELPRTASSWPG